MFNAKWMISMAEPFEEGSVLTELLAFNIADASSISGLSRASLYKLFKTGELRAVKIAGRRMVLREDLLAMLEAAKASQGNLTKGGDQRANRKAAAVSAPAPMPAPGAIASAASAAAPSGKRRVAWRGQDQQIGQAAEVRTIEPKAEVRSAIS
jgi:Helix-turn-helix domain